MPAVSTVGYSKIACFLKKCEINYLVHTMTNSFLYNDVELLQRIQLNDEKALACLMRKYYSGLYRFALQFTKDEEVVKYCIRDVFLGLWQYRCFAGSIFSLQAYLFRVTRGKLNQRTRQEKNMVHPNVNLYAC